MIFLKILNDFSNKYFFPFQFKTSTLNHHSWQKKIKA